MKNIVFRSGSLRMGGVERVMISTLGLFDLTKYRVFLLIEDDNKEKNIFEKDIPSGIKYYFLKPNTLIKKTEFFKENKKNFFYKIMYNIYMEIERRVAKKQTKKILKNLEKEYGPVDFFIDYDWGAVKYIETLDVKNKIVWLHSSINKLLKKKSKIKRFGKRISNYDKIITICDEMKSELINTYPNLKDKIYKIYNPFNIKKIEALSLESDELTENEKKMINKDYIVAVSRLDMKSKDYKTLLKGYKLALEKGVGDSLYIIGNGPDREKIEKIISDYKLENKVFLLGEKKNPYVWMKNSKYFIHSSKFEGFGLVLVEAMILDKGIISSNCEVGPKEILGYGEYGILFNVGNEVELGKEIINLSKNKDIRKNFEEKSKKRKNDFSHEIIKLELEKIFSKN